MDGTEEPDEEEDETDEEEEDADPVELDEEDGVGIGSLYVVFLIAPTAGFLLTNITGSTSSNPK
jgi:hypothetical protein